MSIDTLAQEIGTIARNDGDYQTAIPQLLMARRSGRTEPLACMYMLGLAVVAQGGKQVTMGDKVISYGPGQSLLVTVDLPVVSQVVQADLGKPFLGMLLTLDVRALVQLAAEMDLPPVPRDQAARALSLGPLEEPLLDALIRLVRLLREPQHLSQVAPLVQQEIMVRLLSGPHGGFLRHLIAAGTPSHQVAQAIAWLKLNFSREYSRQFGAPPQRDIKRMRELPSGGVLQVLS